MKSEPAAFQLEISAKRDPLEGRGADEAPVPVPASAAILLNGAFNEESCDRTLQAVSRLLGAGTDSIIVEMQDVRTDDAACLEAFAAQLMTLRSAGKHVQVHVWEASLHATLAGLTGSRDWLLAMDSGVRGARRSIHVDRADTNG